MATLIKVMEDRKYAQISNESIQAWAETVGVTDLSPEILRALGADATYRLHQALSFCSKFLSHSNRRKLTSDDFNRALKLMDVTPVYGYSGSEALEWVNVPELGIHIPHDPPVNLASTALSGDIFHQPGNSYVKAKWAHISGHLIMKSESNSEEKCLSSLPLCSELTQYYHTLFSVITSPSNKLFQTMCEDVGTSANIGPLVGSIIRSVLKGVQKARQKPIILRRLLLIIRALLFNPHIHLGPQNHIHDIVNILVFSVVREIRNPQDTQSIRTLAANILLKLSRSEGEVGMAWELAVVSLSGVLGSSTRPWTQHVGALTGLLPMGYCAFYRALIPIISEYYSRLSQILSNPPSASISSAILAKDTVDAHMTAGLLLAGFVNLMVSLLKRLPNRHKIYVGEDSTKQTRCLRNASKTGEEDDVLMAELVNKLKEIYFIGEEMFGSAFALQVPALYLCWGEEKSFIATSPIAYQEMLSEEDLLSEVDEPPAKRRRKKQIKSLKPQQAQKRIHISPSLAFDNYSLITPVKKRKIFMCIRGCSTRNFEYLKQKKGTLPEIVQHPNRTLLIKYNKAKMTGRMPHWTFIHPVFPPTRPSSSLTYLIL